MIQHLAPRRLVALLLVGLLGVTGILVAIALRVDVHLAVDGVLTRVTTQAATVGDVLSAEGIELAAGDTILPAPSSPVEQGTVIRVVRSITIDLELDGDLREVRGTFRSVGGALAAAGVVLDGDELVEPGLRTPLDDGARVVVRTPRTVTLVADEAERTVATHLSTVGRVLSSQGVELAAADRMVDADGSVVVAGDPVTDGGRVVVRRVTTADEVREVVEEHATSTRTTDELYTDQSRVAVDGVDGVAEETWRLTFVDGEQTDEELLSSQVVTQRVDEVVEQGTRRRPPPPPANTRIADDGSVWFDLARCESGLRWNYDGAYDGGLQFHPNTWNRWKPSGAPAYAYLASPEQQIEAGRRLQAAAGWGPWPGCARKLGLL
jgi:uncharacterized protein YabE (DUF348 family)